MQKQQIPLKNSLLLLLAAIIWGIAFVAQSVGMKRIIKNLVITNLLELLIRHKSNNLIQVSQIAI